MATARELCFEEHDRVCWECGSKDDIEVHHIDGDPANNDIDNLIPLCSGCHGLVHNSPEKLPELAEKLGRSVERLRPNLADVDKLVEDVGQSGIIQKCGFYTLQQGSGDGLTLHVPAGVVREHNLIPGDEVLVLKDSPIPSEIRVYLPTGRVDDGFEVDDDG